MAQANTLDRISPTYVGEDRIGIEVDAESFLAGHLVVSRPVTMRLDYSLAEPQGVVLPIEITVQPKFGDGTGFVRKVYSRVVPSTFTFKPTLAGEYLVLVKERFHNKWQGRTTIAVSGDPFGDVQISERTP